ncbi:lysophospholipid acyltransferase family protein [Prosthecomicrobium sp. N25]|uniref:lysophospholipid acyltransferase family protein n=1 Tax=Prosthecomicrobium sp. N25 TaxID=3129254 RepID=UPI003077974E
MLKGLTRRPGVQRLLGALIARWLRFVYRTLTPVVDPPDGYAVAEAQRPFILAMWHGEHFLMPAGRPPHWTVKAIISRSGDGEIIATVCEAFGISAIRASAGFTEEQVRRRGGVYGLIAAVRELRAGAIVALTADVPKGPARRAGEGIVAIARHSGAPIIPFAVATTRRIHLNNWDKACINLPFGRYAFVIGDPIRVPADADAEALEAARLAVEDGLDRAHARAYALVDGRGEPGGPHG